MVTDLFLVHELDQVKDSAEGRGLLGPVAGLDHHEVPGHGAALQPQPDGARHELVLGQEADCVLRVATVPHQASARPVRPEGPVVLKQKRDLIRFLGECLKIMLTKTIIKSGFIQLTVRFIGGYLKFENKYSLF